MAQIRQAALDYQARRWLRQDWRRFWRPGSQNDPLYRYYEVIERKYDPAQPRVPAGQWEGGQWTSGSGATAARTGANPTNGHAASKPRPSKPFTTGSGSTDQNQTKVASRISPEREAECKELERRDAVICNLMKTNSCWRQAAFRYSQCLIGGYIPPIYH
jgi:hypothetical protein